MCYFQTKKRPVEFSYCSPFHYACRCLLSRHSVVANLAYRFSRTRPVFFSFTGCFEELFYSCGRYKSSSPYTQPICSKSPLCLPQFPARCQHVPVSWPCDIPVSSQDPISTKLYNHILSKPPPALLYPRIQQVFIEYARNDDQQINPFSHTQIVNDQQTPRQNVPMKLWFSPLPLVHPVEFASWDHAVAFQTVIPYNHHRNIFLIIVAARHLLIHLLVLMLPCALFLHRYLQQTEQLQLLLVSTRIVTLTWLNALFLSQTLSFHFSSKDLKHTLKQNHVDQKQIMFSIREDMFKIISSITDNIDNIGCGFYRPVKKQKN